MHKEKFVPVVYKIKKLYLDIYSFNKSLPKRDKYSIGLNVENSLLNILKSCIKASMESQENKSEILKDILIELKFLNLNFRIMNELKIIKTSNYIKTEKQLVEITKMTMGWYKYSKNRNY